VLQTFLGTSLSCSANVAKRNGSSKNAAPSRYLLFPQVLHVPRYINHAHFQLRFLKLMRKYRSP
jgi:hypothetical protein